MENVLKLIGKHAIIHMENKGPGGYISCLDLLQIIENCIKESRGSVYELSKQTTKSMPFVGELNDRFNSIFPTPKEVFVEFDINLIDKALGFITGNGQEVTDLTVVDRMYFPVEGMVNGVSFRWLKDGRMGRNAGPEWNLFMIVKGEEK